MFPTGILLSATRLDLFHQLQKPFGAATPVESKSYLPEPFLRPKSNELAKPKPSSSPAGTTPKRQAACSIVPRVCQLEPSLYEARTNVLFSGFLLSLKGRMGCGALGSTVFSGGGCHPGGMELSC